MSELFTHTPNMPSGYETSSSLPEQVTVDGNTLPWLVQPQEITVCEVSLKSGETFLLASAIGTSPKLLDAARGMTYNQRQNTDNMFYSRIPTVVNSGYSPSVETMPSPATPFPIFVMRNKGGQRVYFGRVSLGIPEEKRSGPTVLRLAVCDKNKQGLVTTVLSKASDRQNHHKLSK